MGLQARLAVSGCSSSACTSSCHSSAHCQPQWVPSVLKSTLHGAVVPLHAGFSHQSWPHLQARWCCCQDVWSMCHHTSVKGRKLQRVWPVWQGTQSWTSQYLGNRWWLMSSHKHQSVYMGMNRNVYIQKVIVPVRVLHISKCTSWHRKTPPVQVASDNHHECEYWH